MKLILGGYANGRTAYAMQNYQLMESDCFDAAAEPLARWNGQRLILHAEQLVNPWLEQGKEPCTEILPWLERWQNAVLITQEVGCGLVPVTPQQRQLREAVGHFNRLLAECAETVERVCCGLGMQLK
ncbi:bifunctional adenosylcobinamide kinase/adenosylcobinamide-phosphate guanylyltransferase [uncultured Ruminococcus sp.]|uniref:bifunctional adenosylcobinamide kinase/adenosylcobinamide-phosphate guanylyltransferase n=1 Tax=uncultured Ruminococcus sp. TaxID=165186 RepID=UPI00259948D3|nr:bifunctional adenosylcobinamide kinase/adenosylcobinamide-phosphate guanylyltransferase [uncultured Ruminococcus sp.]